MACVVWTTESFPVDNTGDADAGLRQVGTTLDNGTVFRFVEFAPGVARVFIGPTPSITPLSCRARSIPATEAVGSRWRYELSSRMNPTCVSECGSSA